MITNRTPTHQCFSDTYRSPVETGLYYLGSRYYSPTIGRFISADEPGYIKANGNILGYNLYNYCVNDPVNRVDNDSSFSFPFAVAIVGGAVYGFIAVATGDYIVGAAYGAAFTEATVNEFVDHLSHIRERHPK